MNGSLAVFPVMAVPEGTVHKDDQLVFDKYHIRFARKLSFIAAVPQPGMPKGPLEQLFGFGVLPPYPGHIVGTFLRGVETVSFTETRNLYFLGFIRFTHWLSPGDILPTIFKGQ